MSRARLRVAGAAFALVGAVTACAVAAQDQLAAARTAAVNQCSQCHTFGKGEPHGQGPSLWGVFGRTAGAAPGYPYSPGFAEALKGRKWDRALLDQWLTDTTAVAPGTQMIYWQDDPAVRAQLIDYLESLR
jgi:cytochrome c